MGIPYEVCEEKEEAVDVECDLDLGVHLFGGNHLEIHRDVEYNPNNHCCRGR